VDAVYICVVFTWHLAEAERLAVLWSRVAPHVVIGGPATGMRGEDFVPGLFVKQGRVITSRGCPNRCWFCSVWRREGAVVRELPIRDGHDVLDDNLLACSEDHIRAVFAMLKRQGEWVWRKSKKGGRWAWKRQRAKFTGGLEAARLKEWHADLVVDLKPETLFFALDTKDDWEPLVAASRLLIARGMHWKGHRIRAYVLCGYKGDTLDMAEARMRAVAGLRVFPMAMLWRGKDGERDKDWIKFAGHWANPIIAGALMREAR